MISGSHVDHVHSSDAFVHTAWLDERLDTMTWILVIALWLLLLLIGWVMLDRGLQSTDTENHTGRDS